MCSTLTCSKCGYKSRTFDNFMDLSVSIPRKAYRYSGCALSIKECLSTFTQPENLEKCGFKCEKCKAVDCMSKEFSIFRLPKILVIHLKRFYNSTMRREKLSTSVDIPSNLDMRDYSSKNSSKFYELNFN